MTFDSLRWFAGKPNSYQRPEQPTMSGFPEQTGGMPWRPRGGRPPRVGSPAGLPGGSVGQARTLLGWRASVDERDPHQPCCRGLDSALRRRATTWQGFRRPQVQGS
jgi:hypothetical protein